MRGHGDDGDVLAVATFETADRESGLNSVHLRHLHIHQDQIEPFLLESRDGFRAVFRNPDPVASTFQQPDGHLLVHAAVFGQQDAGQSGWRRQIAGDEAAHRWRRHGEPMRGLVAHDPQLDREMKLAALSRFAFQPQPSAHQSRQIRGDCQTQSSTAVLAADGLIRLTERFQDQVLLVHRDADARISNRDPQANAIRRGCATDQRLGISPSFCIGGGLEFQRGMAVGGQPSRHLDFTLDGELQRVLDQIDHHLTQPPRIAQQPLRNFVGDADAEPQAFFRGSHRVRSGGPFHKFPEIERLLVQLHPSRFDLGEIQEVVQQPQQRLGRIAGHAQALLLLRFQLGTLQQFDHPQDAVHRSPDLVTHVGQEFALRRIGLFGPALSFVEILDDLLRSQRCHQQQAQRQDGQGNEQGPFRASEVRQRRGQGLLNRDLRSQSLHRHPHLKVLPARSQFAETESRIGHWGVDRYVDLIQVSRGKLGRDADRASEVVNHRGDHRRPVAVDPRRLGT